MPDHFKSLEPKHFKDLGLLELTFVQLEKDFDPVELNLRQVPVSDDYFSDLIEDLSYTVDGLLSQNMEKLLNILYRVDLPERLINECFGLGNPAKSMSELILKRELQKVVLRKLYSSDSN